MARAFDISRRPRHKPAPVSSHPAPSRRRKNGLFNYFIFLVFIGAFIAIMFSFSSTSAPIKNNTKTSPSITTSPTPSPTTSTNQNNNSDSTNKEIKIQILNGTGITSVTEKVKSLLDKSGYKVESASEAQFKYSQTYIYYRSEHSTEAQKISEILKDYKPTLSVSQIDNLFDILIIIGKDNLPQNN